MLEFKVLEDKVNISPIPTQAMVYIRNSVKLAKYIWSQDNTFILVL